MLLIFIDFKQRVFCTPLYFAPGENSSLASSYSRSCSLGPWTWTLFCGFSAVLVKPSRTLWHTWALKPFCPPFLVVGNKLQPLWPSLGSKGQIQTVASRGGKGMQRQGRDSQETTLGQSKGTREIYQITWGVQALHTQLSCVQLLATPWTAAHRASLSITNSRSLPKLMSIESVMPSNRLILCRPLLLLPSIFPSIRVFSDESVLPIRWPKDWNFS